MRGSGPAIRVRRAPSFYGRSIYLDGVSDYLDLQGNDATWCCGNNQGQTGGMNHSTALWHNNFSYRRGHAFFRPLSWMFWVKFTQQQIDDVKADRYNNGNPNGEGIYPILVTAAGQETTITSKWVGLHIWLVAISDIEVRIAAGWGQYGTGDVSRRTLRHGSTDISPDKWYQVVVSFTGHNNEQFSFDPGIEMWANGPIQANVKLKCKDQTSTDIYAILRIEDADGLVKHYWMNADNNYSIWSTGSTGTISLYPHGYNSGSLEHTEFTVAQLEGLNAIDSAEQIKNAIQGLNGHNGSIFCGTDGTGNITLQQKTPGTAGNVDIKSSSNDSISRGIGQIFEDEYGSLITPAGYAVPLSASFASGSDNGVNSEIMKPYYADSVTSGEMTPSPQSNAQYLPISHTSPYNTGQNPTGWSNTMPFMDAFIGRKGSTYTNMYVAECAFWENINLDNDDVTTLYGSGTPLADVTTDSGTYDKAAKTQASCSIQFGLSAYNGLKLRITEIDGTYRNYYFSVPGSNYGVSNGEVHTNNDQGQAGYIQVTWGGAFGTVLARTVTISRFADAVNGAAGNPGVTAEHDPQAGVDTITLVMDTAGYTNADCQVEQVFPEVLPPGVITTSLPLTFTGGTKSLHGWWKLDGPSIDPVDSRLQFSDQTITDNNITLTNGIEYPPISSWQTWVISASMNTQALIIQGGTWSSHTPSG